MKDWILTYNKYEPEKEGLREALCVLGNGYFTTRGAAQESTDDGIHYPGTYLAGGYNRLKTEMKDQVVENESLVNFPNWLPLNFKIADGQWFSLDNVKILSYQQVLNIKEATLSREIHFRDKEGLETILTTKRLVSMDNQHIGVTAISIEPQNWDSEVEVLSALDGRVKNNGVKRYRELNSGHLQAIEARCFEDNGIFLEVRTNQSHIHMAQAALTKVYLNESPLKKVKIGNYKEKNYIAKHFKLKLKKKQVLRIEKTLALYTNRDKAITECGLEARDAVKRAGNFKDLLKDHKLAWKHFWKGFDIDITMSDSKEGISPVVRLHLLHLLQTTSVHSLDLDIGVPPRGWHGEAYRGHILWDELFVFPILNLQLPELTRSLLLYRYRRLSAARRGAKDAGFDGAMYPWQSASNGREESQKIHLNPKSGHWILDNSQLQRHVNLAIVYNVWQYFEATQDFEFLSFFGAEIILEIARFWASVAVFNPQRKRYEIRGVMGPDEYHDGYPGQERPGLNNNTYTNLMVSWTFLRAKESLEAIPQDRKHELQEKLKISDEELYQWEDIRKKLYIPFHQDGVISQFEGYEDLKELNWGKYRKKYKNIDRLDRILEAEEDSANNYKVSKQADVLMLFYLFSAEELRTLFNDLGYELKRETIKKTIDYYMKRTSHGSTLSRLAHSWVLARLDREVSWGLFCKALKSDVDDIQDGTTSEGIHLGAMVGTVDILQRCYLGMEFRGNVLRFNPVLPKELNQMQTRIRYRGHCLRVTANHKKLTVKSEQGAAKPIKIAYCEQEYDLKKGQKQKIDLDQQAC